MSRRPSYSGSRPRRPLLPEFIGEYPLGRQTGLPLIMCDECGLQRVLELVVQSDDNGNKGRIFFKCPRNIQGLPGTCGFYYWQREYLAKLVSSGKLLMELGQNAEGLVEVESGDRTLVKIKDPSGDKIEGLVGLVKAMFIFNVVVVAIAAFHAARE